MEFEFPSVAASKLRITARSLKVCPEWHRGAGQPSWIFIDEIVVE
jgi:hexosaminidase